VISDAAYWLTLAHLPKWNQTKINSLIVKFHHEDKISLEDFFGLDDLAWKERYELSENDIAALNNAKSELAGNSLLAESLNNQGVDIIPIISADYSSTLKSNLKMSSPCLLYVKGNKKILEEDTIAIVGSRNAEKISLDFTDNIAKKASKDYKVIVSGFAKGVDKQALDSALKYKGHSIIVLPQGITTFTAGFNIYYKQIVEGDVLVLSTFHPKAPWKVELAMARNPIIYGLAAGIYVAESSEKGGTWSGVVDGFRKGRTIYVRKPNDDEKNANNLLIEKGAIPVDFDGNILDIEPKTNRIIQERIKKSSDLASLTQTTLFS
jgi:predicted Rossmann fold nucleotide-binding protein DprA/Smf involved in DNA uptake